MNDMVSRLQAFAAAMPAIQAEAAREQEQLVAQLRFSLPGFVGRLDGRRLFVTSAELEQLRGWARTIVRDRTPPGDFSGLDVMLETED